MQQKNLTILIVEDHAVTRDGLCAYFEKHPDITVLGATGEFDQAMKIASQQPPDVILLDLHLPGKQGPRTLVQSFRQFTNAKLVVFSGDERPAVTEAVLEAGADLFIPKSEPASRVLELIRELLGGTRKEVPTSISKLDLSPGQKHILHLLAKGWKYSDIANERSTSPDTVRKQCETLQLKLRLDSRERLIAWAVTNGFGTIDDAEFES